ncbi:hypothetical protein C3747_68g166 [Trypanosoma cruzi]|uniref:Nodulin-like domain-containing protein n=2 Tax=Trypanosoma cruzi TaxID=5693 RepID=Q4DWN2_TRYCC|nr:hypothetical protein, conserved [Trypanosoma cruzi]EAN96928.1 hypothetical protein, conserved [Trypanosoma cruzi]PWV10518.1 hypothetical protein C3747_68g166 [Trypanosoma cruzi]RNC61404.1 hypothetical protein TcCL_ESM00910 [Trypanosoma cruzi]|eukprot:XP_818779.1 hypothetical protein [Trypanosoma cruzi strain CL Brener]
MAASIQQAALLCNTEGLEEMMEDGDETSSLLNHDLDEEEEEVVDGRTSGSSLHARLLGPELPVESVHLKGDMGPENVCGEGNGIVAAGGGEVGRRSWRSFNPRLPPLSEPRRFWQLVVGALCCVAVSSSYTFNLYNGRIQSKYNFTQSQMTTISTIGDIVGVLILPLGAIYDHYGAQPIFLIALVLFPLGGIFFGLTFANAIEGSMAAFSLYVCMQSLGSSLLDLGSVMTMLSIFPANKGAVVAVMKTFCGMGSAILGAIHLAFFPSENDSDTSSFFYFLSVLAMLASFFGVVFVEVPPYMIRGCEKRVLTEAQRKERYRIRRQFLRQKAPTTRFAIGFTIVLILVFFLPVQGAISAYMELDNSYHVTFACVSVGLCAFYPMMALPWKVLDRKLPLPHTGSFSFGSGRASRLSRFSLLSRGTMDSTAAIRELDYIAPQYQTTLVQNLRTLRFWALLWLLFATSGAQIIIMGNMRFLFGALAGKPLGESFVALLVVITGVGSGLGRILLSVLEMMTQGRSAEERTPITFTLFVPSVLSVATLLLLLILPTNALPLPCFTIALVNGSAAAAIVIVLRTIFATDVAKHYNVCSFAGIAASLLMNRLVYGEWYTREADKQGGTLCYGRQCVLMPIIFSLVTNISGVIAAMYIHWDYSSYCRRMLEMRAQRLPNRVPHVADNSNSNVVDIQYDDGKGSLTEVKTVVESPVEK